MPIDPAKIFELAQAQNENSRIPACLSSSCSCLRRGIDSKAPGMSWRYNMIQEVGKGLRVPDLKTDADGKIRRTVLYRIAGIENVDGEELFKFEMHRAGVVTNTDLLSVGKQGIVCVARINLDGGLIKLDPPQTMIAAPLRPGVNWNFNGQVGEMKVQQHYDVAAEEHGDVPAG